MFGLLLQALFRAFVAVLNLMRILINPGPADCLFLAISNCWQGLHIRVKALHARAQVLYDAIRPETVHHHVQECSEYPVVPGAWPEQEIFPEEPRSAEPEEAAEPEEPENINTREQIARHNSNKLSGEVLLRNITHRASTAISQAAPREEAQPCFTFLVTPRDDPLPMVHLWFESDRRIAASSLNRRVPPSRKETRDPRMRYPFNTKKRFAPVDQGTIDSTLLTARRQSQVVCRQDDSERDHHKRMVSVPKHLGEAALRQSGSSPRELRAQHTTQAVPVPMVNQPPIQQMSVPLVNQPPIQQMPVAPPNQQMAIPPPIQQLPVAPSIQQMPIAPHMPGNAAVGAPVPLQKQGAVDKEMVDYHEDEEQQYDGEDVIMRDGPDVLDAGKNPEKSSAANSQSNGNVRANTEGDLMDGIQLTGSSVQHASNEMEGLQRTHPSDTKDQLIHNAPQQKVDPGSDRADTNMAGAPSQMNGPPYGNWLPPAVPAPLEIVNNFMQNSMQYAEPFPSNGQALRVQAPLQARQAQGPPPQLVMLRPEASSSGQGLRVQPPPQARQAQGPPPQLVMLRPEPSATPGAGSMGSMQASIGQNGQDMHMGNDARVKHQQHASSANHMPLEKTTAHAVPGIQPLTKPSGAQVMQTPPSSQGVAVPAGKAPEAALTPTLSGAIRPPVHTGQPLLKPVAQADQPAPSKGAHFGKLLNANSIFSSCEARGDARVLMHRLLFTWSSMNIHNEEQLTKLSEILKDMVQCCNKMKQTGYQGPITSRSAALAQIYCETIDERLRNIMVPSPRMQQALINCATLKNGGFFGHHDGLNKHLRSMIHPSAQGIRNLLLGRTDPDKPLSDAELMKFDADTSLFPLRDDLRELVTFRAQRPSEWDRHVQDFSEATILQMQFLQRPIHRAYTELPDRSEPNGSHWLILGMKLYHDSLKAYSPMQKVPNQDPVKLGRKMMRSMGNIETDLSALVSEFNTENLEMPLDRLVRDVRVMKDYLLSQGVWIQDRLEISAIKDLSEKSKAVAAKLIELSRLPEAKAWLGDLEQAYDSVSSLQYAADAALPQQIASSFTAMHDTLNRICVPYKRNIDRLRSQKQKVDHKRILAQIQNIDAAGPDAEFGNRACKVMEQIRTICEQYPQDWRAMVEGNFGMLSSFATEMRDKMASLHKLMTALHPKAHEQWLEFSCIWMSELDPLLDMVGRTLSQRLQGQ